MKTLGEIKRKKKGVLDEDVLFVIAKEIDGRKKKMPPTSALSTSNDGSADILSTDTESGETGETSL